MREFYSLKKNSIKNFYLSPKSNKFLIIVIIAAFIVRCIPLIRYSTLWAEDATVLYGPLISPLNSKTEGSIFSIYSGQYFIFNNLIAKSLIWLIVSNLVILPLLSTISNLIIVLIMASFWLRSTNLFPARKLRVFMFGFTLLSPASWEPLGNMANVATYLLIGNIAMMGWAKARNRRMRCLEFIFLAISAFTGTIGLLLPFMILTRCLLIKKMYIPELLFSIVAVIVQFTTWSSRGALPIGGYKFLDLVKTYFYVVFKRIFAEIVVGQNGGHYYEAGMRAEGWMVIGAVPMIGITYLFVVSVKNARDFKLIVGSLSIIFLLLVYFVMYAASGLNAGLSSMLEFGAWGRHLLISHILLFSLFLHLVGRIKSRDRRKQDNVIIILISLCFFSGVIFDYKILPKGDLSFVSKWNSFSNCIELQPTRCQAEVPPGGPWQLRG